MNELRMYVELLFEGRTMTRETIDLKEEIFGNLVARYEDLLAQGASEAEALERTKASITSVDDVLDGEESADDAQGADRDGHDADADGDVRGADATLASVTVPIPGDASAARRRPSAGVVIAAVAGVFLVLVAVVVALGAAGGRAYETVRGSSTVVSDQGETVTSGVGDRGETVTSGDLFAEVSGGSADLIAPYAGTALSDTVRVEELVRALPLGAYVTEVDTDVARGTATITYAYEDRDYLARDDDYVDLALVYDATALMSAMGDLGSVTVIEVETKDHDYDRDVTVFERTVVEALLGTRLSPDVLTEGAWEPVREQVTDKRVWNEIWDRSELD